jgi:DNA-directed RNA polymerase sigma subunit (sigma70/sigma32)
VVNQSVPPFTARPVEPEGWEALDRIVAAHEAMQAAIDERAAQARLRATAIADARKHGVSLDAIAERLGVSRERVRQIAASKGEA